jgi:hypothetical protein
MMEHDGENPWKIRRRFQNTKPGITCLTLLDPILCSFNIFPSVKSAAKKKKVLGFCGMLIWLMSLLPLQHQLPRSLGKRQLAETAELFRLDQNAETLPTSTRTILAVLRQSHISRRYCWIHPIAVFLHCPHHQPKKQHESWVFNLSNPIPLILNWHHLGCV